MSTIATNFKMLGFRVWKLSVIRVILFWVIWHEKIMACLAFSPKLKELSEFFRKNLNTLNTIIRVIRIWINYHGISDNQKLVGQFIYKILKSSTGGSIAKMGDQLTWKILGYPLRCKTYSILISCQIRGRTLMR
ncbi:reverse transcriptase [Xenorhabdus sp. KJ12.1]|nr:reverse transcriptase [Xenorhabdus sp. KJ12.1]